MAQFGNYPPPDPRLKKWLFVQLLGGFIVIGGILAIIYALAQAQGQGIQQGFTFPVWETAAITVGGVIHGVGRWYARRYN